MKRSDGCTFPFNDFILSRCFLRNARQTLIASAPSAFFCVTEIRFKDFRMKIYLFNETRLK